MYAFKKIFFIKVIEFFIFWNFIWRNLDISFVCDIKNPIDYFILFKR